MKQIIAFFLIIIGTLVIILSATMINQWLGVLMCGFWLVILGLLIELQDFFNKK